MLIEMFAEPAVKCCELPLGDLQIDPGNGSNLAVVLRQAGKSYVRSRSVYACDVIREGAESKDKLARKA